MGNNTPSAPDAERPSVGRRSAQWAAGAAVAGVVVAGIMAAPTSGTTLLVDPIPRTAPGPTPNRSGPDAIAASELAASSAVRVSEEAQGDSQTAATPAAQTLTPSASASPSQVAPPGAESTSQAPAPQPPAAPRVLVPGAKVSAGSDGIDFAAPLGAPVYAAVGGEVVAAGPAPDGGNWVVVRTGVAYVVYGNVQRVVASTGDTVSAGDRIALVGTEGRGEPHLHFEVRLGGTAAPAINPVAWLLTHGIEV